MGKPTGVALPGHAAPAAGFEVPLEMLESCHRRVENQCSTLRRLVDHLAKRGADADARAAAVAIRRYFEVAAPDHHADEEVDLFPALVAATSGVDAGDLRAATAALIATLRAEHRELEGQWQRLKPPLDALADGREGSRPATLEAAAVEAYAGLYARHIEREETELLPLAARLLSIDELDRIGRAMRARRGIEI
ncbi:MAG: hemerythrin domain-containing protein [Burkholderiales bacterium]|nr:hemerythrin domain-containing protein [Burkholderiales bacterium]